ncbi:CRISPR-associated endoribonuclease Cas6 [Thermodesulfovibrio thiophilus]|uniref:CRISPR-associated endoribonuclease Cas6 n=1 Tax=Thermodesulfovibrio thiophilus TaxID=340095 RepID=UPI00041FF371|nr:CRISPR-associated endoribonuclease Cas6 [Thermodesulfovibrio thiophilus]
MRFKVFFKTDKLPILYRQRFMALIKEILSKQSPEYKKILYPDQGFSHSKKVKPFTFGILMPPQRKSVKEKIFIDEKTAVEDIVFYFPHNSYISFLISSIDYEFIINLYNGLIEEKTFNFGNGITLEYNRTSLIREKKIDHDEVIFKTISPILIEDEQEKPVLPFKNNLESFNFHLNAIHDRIFKDIRKKGLSRLLKFEPLQIKKSVVKHTLSGFRQQTGKPYMMLTCFEGCFRVTGDKEDLSLLYQMGIGLRTGQGFGMVDVV